MANLEFGWIGDVVEFEKVIVVDLEFTRDGDGIVSFHYRIHFARCGGCLSGVIGGIFWDGLLASADGVTLWDAERLTDFE